MSDQLAPHNPDAEEAVLGNILIEPGNLNEAGFLRTEDFFIVKHGYIWQAIQDAKPQGIDYLTIVSALEKRGRLAEVGGAAYVLSLINKTPNSLNTEGYARLVEEDSARRRLLVGASHLARLAHAGDKSIDTALSEAESIIRGINNQHVATIDRSKSVKDVAALVLDRARLYRDNPQEVRGMTCGIAALDKTIGGYVAGRLYLKAARPAMGKSSMLAQVATGLALNGHPVLIFSLEMTEEDMVWRMACQLARMDSRALELGKIRGDAFKPFEAAIETITKLPIWIEDKGGRTVAAMRSIATRYAGEQGIGAVMVDTLNRVGDVAAGSNLYQGMTNASHAIADWAHESDYAVISAVQLSRGNTQRTDKRPQLPDLRDSGAIEEDADYIGGLHREYYYTPDKKELEHLAAFYTLKHRHGPADADCELYYDAKWPGFGSLVTKTVQLDPPAPPRPPLNSLEAGRLKVLRKEQAGKLPNTDAVDIGGGILLPTGTGGK